MPDTRSLVTRGGRPLQASQRNAPFADLLVSGGSIRQIGEPGMPAPADAQVFDASGTLMPAGLINGHTHGSGNLAKATHDRWSLELLLNGAPGWAANHTPAQKALNTTIGAVEMLQKGCTSCYDLHVRVSAGERGRTHRHRRTCVALTTPRPRCSRPPRKAAA